MSVDTARSVTVVDYGMGNLRSVAKIVSRIGGEVRVSSDPADLAWAERLILPGVGAFPQAMRHLNELGLVEPLHEMVIAKKKPILGICLGMELMADESEELTLTKGLGWFKARMVAFDRTNGVRVPHVGWNQVRRTRPSPLFDQFEDGSFLYFVHSYYMECANPDDVVAVADYGGPFTAAIAHDNIFGMQFHPEKSQARGFDLLVRFVTGSL